MNFSKCAELIALSDAFYAAYIDHCYENDFDFTLGIGTWCAGHYL